MRAIVILTVILALANRASADTLRIMPMGDSITVGADDHNLTPGGYRTTLYGLLGANGYDFNFVGSQQTNPGSIPDNKHEGYGGYQLPNIRFAMTGSLAIDQPDVVLLLGGTNDVTYSLNGDPSLTVEGIAARLDALLSELYAYRPVATVFVGTIPPAQTDMLHSQRSAEVNALMPGMLAAHAALGRQVYLVDLRAVIKPADLADSLHPSPVGYAKMAHAWYSAIAKVFPPPSSIAGDLNLDGFVDIFDVNLVSAHWGEAGPEGDANSDGAVDVFDVNLISDHWTGGVDSAALVSVAEPASLAIAILASFCGYTVVRRESLHRREAKQ